MNISTYIRANIFHSTATLTGLAQKNPEKYLGFASKIIEAKRASVRHQISVVENEMHTLHEEISKAEKEFSDELAYVRSGAYRSDAGCFKAQQYHNENIYIYQREFGIRHLQQKARLTENNELSAKLNKYSKQLDTLANLGKAAKVSVK
ncbi:hypothetical protein [Burkholderia ambifaria]|uniref:hypothetical protein n=1 Tax=Burkholderia ambifaria TaxID=152480 RepID=UPI0015924E7F|nr:hypothetical protein [Burkholderia ambifaria]